VDLRRSGETPDRFVPKSSSNSRFRWASLPVGLAAVALWARRDRESASGADLPINTAPASPINRAPSRWPSIPLVPAVGVILALMMLAQAAASIASRSGRPWADTVYWLSVNGMVLVVAAVQLFGSPKPRERLALVIALGLALYSVKLLAYPIGFTYFDELSHTQTAFDIFRSGHLFDYNSLQPVSPYYPGLELITVTLARLSGLSLFVSGALVIGVGRIMLTAALYALFVEASGSQRVAGVGAVVYMANPSFLYFDGGFSYESLALPLAVVALAMTLRWMRLPPSLQSRRLLGYTAVVVAALVVTHHLTSYLFAGLAFALCVCVILAWGWGDASRKPPWQIAVFAAVTATAWFVGVASITFPYLHDVLQPAITGVGNVITGGESARSAFSEAPTEATASPFWLKTTAFASVLLIVACLPFGAVLAWRRRTNPAALLLGAIAVAYLPIQALRLTGAGVETANRSSEFVFLGIGFVIALFLVHLLEHRSLPTIELGRFRPRLALPKGSAAHRIGLPVAAMAAVAILFTGGVTVFWPPYARLPGPYLVGGDVRSVTPKGLAAVHWMRAHLGPENRVLTDRTTGQLAGAFGYQYNVEGYVDQYSVARVFVTPTLDPVDRKILRRKRVDYLIVDRRLTTSLPARGWYFAANEINENTYKRPVALRSLTKFAHLPGVSVVYDDGTIQIYDIRGLELS
jgi:hypothetical protein